ncbi:hypothetical protein PS627_01151 [Pseudomonas fluorescens]|nr:hypothetical protein PS627_01151 [Pseudomonas fluorescens]VVP72281.1 hypothetical protein PS910_01049 [Pseudomonas fluorescens]
MNTTPQDNRNVVTLVIQHKVRPQALGEYEQWIKRTVHAARHQPGHLDVNVIRPDDGGGYQNFPDDYSVIQELADNNQLTVRIAYNLFTNSAGKLRPSGRGGIALTAKR